MAEPKRKKEPEAAKPATTRVLPMELRIGDRLIEETGEWDVTGRPFTTTAGKTAHARVRKVSQPEVTDRRTWSAHERVAVRRG
jgi:hypothetical protein